VITEDSGQPTGRLRERSYGAKRSIDVLRGVDETRAEPEYSVA
jgi:hypothetical protein